MQHQISIEEICMKLKPILGKKIDQIYLRYSLADSNEEKQDIARLLSALYYKYHSDLLNQKILLEPPKKEDVQGDYPLATVNYSDKKLHSFNLREQDWPRHVCITGMSGSGKTTIAFHIIKNFINQNKSFLVFDWKKSFRPLLKASNQIRLFTVGNEKVTNNLKFNINEPPKGINPQEWVMTLSDLLTEIFFASFGVHKVILETLDDSFKEWGIYNGSENYPTWHHIKWRLEEKLNKAKGREEGWLESALRIATILTYGDFGKLVNYKGENRISVEEILNKQTILELNSLGNVEKKFFANFVLTYIYKLKKQNQNKINEKFTNAIIVDEAHNIFLKHETHFVEESITDMIYREMREYGTSLVCLDQHISKLSDTLKGNSACHIAFQQQLPQDIYEISELMHLKENKKFFSQIPVGSAIVKLAERYTSPFLVDINQAELRNQEVTETEIIQRMKALTLNKDFKQNKDKKFNKEITQPTLLEKHKVLLDFIKQRQNLGNSLEEIKEILEINKKFYTSEDIDFVLKIIEKKEKRTPEQKFIEFLRENPSHELATTTLYKKLKLSPRKGNVVKNKLLKSGAIKIIEKKNSKGWKKLIRLSDSHLNSADTDNK